MKNWLSITALNSLFLVLIVISPSCSKSNSMSNNMGSASLQNQILSYPIDSLNSTEINALVFTREEEKLARDVYIFLYNKWQTTLFLNISQSEQTHMDAILTLLHKYQLLDPAQNNSIGIFQNQTLQNLYNQLTADGSASFVQALKVGALIEDLDISDIQTAITLSDNMDITFVFNNLTKGSRNHLRSFYSNLLANNSSYAPLYISQEEFDRIISTPKEQGY